MLLIATIVLADQLTILLCYLNYYPLNTVLKGYQASLVRLTITTCFKSQGHEDIYIPRWKELK